MPSMATSVAAGWFGDRGVSCVCHRATHYTHTHTHTPSHPHRHTHPQFQKTELNIAIFSFCNLVRRIQVKRIYHGYWPALSKPFTDYLGRLVPVITPFPLALLLVQRCECAAVSTAKLEPSDPHKQASD